MAILKAKAENLSLSSDFLLLSDPSSEIPTIAGLSKGEGKKWITASSIAWTPLFLKAEPQITGTISLLRVLILKPFIISLLSSSPSSKYLFKRSSDASAATSIIASLYFSHVALNSSGISSST